MDSRSHRYDDLLLLPHPDPQRHVRMSATARAAQFSPFAALTGYEQAILAMQRHRCNQVELSEEELDCINDVLLSLQKRDAVTLTYFQHDPGPDGSGGTADGQYREISGTVGQISYPQQSLRILQENGWTDVSFSDILTIQRQKPQQNFF